MIFGQASLFEGALSKPMAIEIRSFFMSLHSLPVKSSGRGKLRIVCHSSMGQQMPITCDSKTCLHKYIKMPSNAQVDIER